MPSVFLDKAKPPTAEAVDEVLGAAAPSWARLRDGLAARFGKLAEKWGYSGKAYGWSLKLAQGKRTVCYLIPNAGAFVVAFALGEKACAAARASGLPAAVKEVVAGAKKFVEGRAVRLEVRRAKDLDAILELAVIKMAS